MKSCIGSVARGNKFFVRQNLIDKIWGAIESDKQILLVAPRRVGKTSLMYYIKDNPKENYYFLFITTESVNSKDEYYKRLRSMVLSSNLVNKGYKILSFLDDHRPALSNIGKDGIGLAAKKDTDYFHKFVKVMEKIDTGKNKLVFLLDEFTSTVDNIRKDKGEREAIQFLHSNRELRQTFSEKVQFIYSGSIGLESIVRDLNGFETINDIVPVSVEQLTKPEAKEFISMLLEDVTFELEESTVDLIISKVEYLIPIYIQMIIDGINEIAREGLNIEIDDDVIVNAFKKVIKDKNFFETWLTRLKKYYREGGDKFAKELLTILSRQSSIEKNEIHDLAVKYKLQDKYKSIVDSLVHDGYINNNDDSQFYRFNSPILKMWWRENVTN
jgi:hypothetical protein